MLLLLLACLSACTRKDPQAAFDHALQTFRHGDIAAAEMEANKGYTQFHRLSTEWAWKFRLLQVNSLVWQGRSERALALLAAEPSPPTVGDLAVQKKRLEAAAYMALNRLSEGEQRLQEAEKLCAASNSPACAKVIFDRGGMEIDLGHFAEGQRLVEHTLELAREQQDRFLEASSLLTLSHSALQQEHFDQAVTWADSAYKIASEVDAEDIAQNALGNLGWAWYKLGEPDRAEPLLLDARKRATQLGDVIDQVKWLTVGGYIYLDAENYPVAEQSYRQALDLARQINSQEDILNALMSLALVAERTGKLEQARDYANQTISLAPAEGNRLDVLYPMLVKGRVAARLHDTAEAEKTFREIEEDPKSHVFLKWEAQHSLAQLYEDEKQPEAAEKEYRDALSTFEAAHASLQQDTSLPFPANASRIYDDYIHFLVSQGKTAEALQVADYGRGRALAVGLGIRQKETSFQPDPPKAQEIARKAGGTILFYWLGEKQSYLWAITPRKTTLHALPAKLTIESLAQRYRNALAGQQEFLPATDADGHALYTMLINPALEAIPKDGKVFVIPDGSLNTLNFETLLSPVPGSHYWIEDVTVANASSLRVLASAKGSGQHTPNLLLMGNAVQPNAEYPELRNAAAEMESIGKHFLPVQEKIYARDEAAPPAYLASHPEQFSYIHFVAHGTASRLSPLDSAIVLSRAGPASDSFKLYARDIIHHPIRADLVTISACYGAGSRAYSGEGLVGLSWAFLYAGAHNVIGALWEVSDTSTPQLMDELYRGLNKKQTPESALRAAKLSMLHSGGAFSKPFYWAPFLMYTGS